MFPLRISGLGQGQTWIDVYVLADGAARDQRGALSVEKVAALDAGTAAQMQGLPARAVATRLSYHGPLEGLKVDAVFDLDGDRHGAR